MNVVAVAPIEFISSVTMPEAFSSLASWVGVREGPGVNRWGFIQGKWNRRNSCLAWLVCVGTSVPRQAFHTSGYSTLHSWKGPSFNRNVDGFVMSYLLICSWTFSFLLPGALISFIICLLENLVAFQSHSYAKEGRM